MNIAENEEHGIQLHPHRLEIIVWLFADDVVLLLVTDVGLQDQWNVLARGARALDPTVSHDKYNIAVHRMDGT